jgi:penicillin-binding protein 2
MKLLEPIKDHHFERRMFIGRVVFFVIIGFFLFGSVIARLVQLQVFDHELFAEKSQGNRIRIEAMPPTRGLIFDRKGRVLAENLPAYQLELVPEQVKDLDNTLNRLAEIQLIDKEEIPRIKSLSLSGPRFKPITLRFLLSETEISHFAIQRPRFPGVDFHPRLMRYYPHGKSVAHALGYVGATDTTDLARLDPRTYVGTAYTGKTGIEIKFESDLHGNPGYQQIVTNARGRQVPPNSRERSFPLLEKEHPMPGANLYLSVDLDLQILATKALAGRRGSIVAINPENGEILTLVSAPTFDPNIFVTGMSIDEFRALQSDVRHPLFNRAVQGTYPPGSTIKPMLALAALEIGVTNLTRRNFCRGFYTLPKSTHRYRDWKPGGHGAINLNDAIAQSCDVYFYEISTAIGIDQMHFYLDQFGFGQYTGMDIINEHRGLLPSRDWKRRTFREPAEQIWFPGETVIASIGQGYMLTTPLQLANATAILATRGKRFEPRIVVAIENPLTGTKRIIPPNRLHDVEIDNDLYWQSVISAMHAVMQSEQGTAWATGRDAMYKMAGKSGTAQVFSVGQQGSYEEKEIKEHLRDHALFISFAPLENPKIAVAVVVENGSSGSSVAAPIARVIMDSYLGVNSNVL